MVGYAEKREFGGLKFSFSAGKKSISEKIGEKPNKIRKKLPSAGNYTCSAAHNMVKFYIRQGRRGGRRRDKGEAKASRGDIY